MFVVFHKETTIYMPTKRNASDTYKTERAAKGALTRAVRDGRVENRDDFDIAEYSEFKMNIEKQIERVNLMSQKKFMEPANTPLSCSPSSNTYWSM